jgi:uncharacterized protein GlcG (DUF336 family)
MEMNLELAKRLLKIGVTEAKDMGKPCSIALVDENGWLVGLHRMDGTPIPTAEIARDKAWTAAVFQMPSSDVSCFGDPKIPGSGFNLQNWNDRLTPIPGGFPIWEGDRLIGAIGVCGGTPAEDVSLCQTVIEEMHYGDKSKSNKKK